MTPRKRPVRSAVETSRALRFPFSAVVGQESVKLALLLNAVDPSIGGVLLRGHKGSAKSTLARGLASLLPGGAPFVELPVGATEDRLVGSFDLKAALTEGVQRFTPGLLASADAGVLYVDEVNLLPDHLVDVLLDVAASGVNRVERDGVSHEHASRFVLVGSMNPEEGQLRPQLLDRFGLAADVIASSDPHERAEAVARRLAFDAEPVDFVEEWDVEEGALRARLAVVAGTVRSSSTSASASVVPDDVRTAISVLCAEMGVEGLRADIVICRAAAALALWEEREVATLDDVARVAPLALSHRRRRSPLEHQGMDSEEFHRALESARARVVPLTSTPFTTDMETPPHQVPNAPKPTGPGTAASSPRSPDGPGTAASSPRSSQLPAPARGRSGEGDGPVIGGGLEVSPVPDLLGRSRSSPERRNAASSGEPYRTDARSERTGAQAGLRPAPGTSRGRIVGDRSAGPRPTSIALAPTVAAAAVRIGSARSAVGQEAATAPVGEPERGILLVLESEDLREAVREEPQSRLVVFALDTSGSMGAQERVAAAKRTISGLLLNAYAARDRVALVTFRSGGACTVLSPTGSVEVASHRLDGLATGGGTPLAAGIEKALELAEAGIATGRRAVIILVTDGRATVARGGLDPLDDALIVAGRVRQRGIEVVVVDAEQGPVRLGLATRMAAAMGGRCISLDQLDAVSL